MKEWQKEYITSAFGDALKGSKSLHHIQSELR
jgi:hypothetical protein